MANKHDIIETTTIENRWGGYTTKKKSKTFILRILM